MLLSAGNAIGPLVCGFLVTASGWRWFNWMSTIIAGIIFVSVSLLVPETRFDRRQSDGSINLLAPAKDHDKKYSVEECEHHTDNATAHSATTVTKKKSYLQQLSLWSGTAEGINYASLFLRPFPLLLYPAVLWAMLSCK